MFKIYVVYCIKIEYQIINIIIKIKLIIINIAHLSDLWNILRERNKMK